MASVTGYTAARMQAIEDSAIIDGAVVGDDLILTRYDTTTINAGNVRGPIGPGNTNNAWTAYTSTISQGASTNIAKTTLYSKWVRGIDRTITWNFSFQLTASGTSGSGVVLTVPVLAEALEGIGGSGLILDASTSVWYNAQLVGVSTSSLYFIGDWGGPWGAQPALAAASGDVLRGTVTYEAAT